MTDWQVAYVLWWLANTFGVCRTVDVTCATPSAPVPVPLTLFTEEP